MPKCLGRAVLLGLALWLTNSLSAADVKLTESGRPAAQVIVAPDVSREAKQAIKDLVEYVKQISGATLPQVAEPVDDGQTRLWIGVHPKLGQSVPGLDLEFKQAEELLIAVRGRDVVIVGRDRWSPGGLAENGTAQAVYTFIEQMLGVRWFWPGQGGEDVPQAATIALAEQTYRYAPQLKQRGLRIINFVRAAKGLAERKDDAAFIAAMKSLDDQAETWYRRQRGGGSGKIRGGHAFNDWFARYGQSHPDYFALQPDGTRSGWPGPERAKLCLSNPAVVQQWVEEAVKQLTANPGLEMVSASPNDSSYSGECVCANCQAWDVAEAPQITLRWKNEEKQWPALTDRYVRFWNLLAAELAKAMPGRQFQIGGWAYGSTRTPPLREKPDARLAIGFVGALPWSGQDERQRDRGLWEQWAKDVKSIYWRPNLFYYRWGLPSNFAGRAGEDFRFMAERGLVGMDVDSINHEWASYGLSFYVLTKLAWNPRADVEAMVQDYTDRAFGPGAQAMRSYYRLAQTLHERAADATEGKHRYEIIDLYPPIYDAAAMAQLRQHLETALAATASSPPHLARVRFVGQGLEFAQAQLGVMQTMSALRAAKEDKQTQRRSLVAAAAEACAARDALMQAHATDFVLGVPQQWLAWKVRIMQDYLGPVRPQDLALLEQAQDPARIPLPTRWAFRADPASVGQGRGWSTPPFEDNQWRELLVTSTWGQQLQSADIDDPINKSFSGTGWYRITFQRPVLTPGQGLWLELGAVKQSCRVYLNGKPAGEWNGQGPLRFDLTDLLADGPNTLVVQVRSSVEDGGISGGASLRQSPPQPPLPRARP